MIGKIQYYLFWLLRYKLKNKKIPLTSSIIITDKCNLQCRHCTVSNLGYRESSFGEITADIETLYNKGARILVMTGGEPFLWSDADHTFEDTVIFAKRKGFFRIVVCTNGTFKLSSSADYLWVSLDGFSNEHNELRGNIYEKVLNNILTSAHKNIYINFTVSKINGNNFEKAVEDILKHKKIKGMLLHLFTPYLNCDRSLLLGDRERESVIDRIIQIKKKHPLRISNTFDGLKALKNNMWDRPLWSSVVINRGRIGPCCCREGIYDNQVCKTCGCSPAAETFVLQQLKPLAILENLRFL
ncbi:MAG: radical SAM protein [Candidatus Omnitrophica bacterium]|nr:radical SAM protein [Candidatus Omnitrophota bacterium]